MNELEYQEEWLSAYLDDELTDEQRVVVEQRLAMDPAAQATFEDLQRVRSMVAKLPNWSGSNLKFTIPTEAPGSFDEADEASAHDSDNELSDFEDVPRVITGTEELRRESRVSVAKHADRDSSFQWTRSVIGWIATAATVLLVVGVGSLYWQNTGPSVAHNEMMGASPAIAAKSAPLGMESNSLDSGGVENNAVESGDFDSAAMSRGSNDALSRAAEFGAPMGGPGTIGGAGATGYAVLPGDAGLLPEGVGQSGAMSAARADSAPLVNEPNSAPALDALALQSNLPFRDGANDLKPKGDMRFAPTSPSPTQPGDATGGLGGARSIDFAMNNLPSDAPAAELPPPSLGLSRAAKSESADPTNVDNANRLMEDNAVQRNASPASLNHYARSETWLDEEIQSMLTPDILHNRSDQLIFGSNAYQRTAEQKPGEVEAESVLMAGIKTEVADSPEFFQNIVTSNRLVEVDQRPMLNQLSVENQSSAKPNAAPKTQTASTLDSHSRTQGNSFVLFLNINEANQILNQLQEKGQVSSQVWHVKKQPESQVMFGKEVNASSPAVLPNDTDQRATGALLKQKAEASPSDKVILLLNGLPN